MPIKKKKVVRRKKIGRDRTYTFTVAVQLPDSRTGESRNMKTYLYGIRTKTEARETWFKRYLDVARKNGLRGLTKQLHKKLPLTIERIAQRADTRITKVST